MKRECCRPLSSSKSEKRLERSFQKRKPATARAAMPPATPRPMMPPVPRPLLLSLLSWAVAVGEAEVESGVTAVAVTVTGAMELVEDIDEETSDELGGGADELGVELDDGVLEDEGVELDEGVEETAELDGGVEEGGTLVLSGGVGLVSRHDGVFCSEWISNRVELCTKAVNEPSEDFHTRHKASQRAGEAS